MTSPGTAEVDWGAKLAAAVSLLDALAPHADLGGDSLEITPFIEAMRKAHAKAKDEAQKAAEEYAP